MSLRDTLKKGLVTVAAVAALSMPATGCVQGSQYQTVPKVKETVETYVVEYDKPTIPQMIQLYVADNSKMPKTLADIMPYRMVSADMNNNGILDYQSTLKIYKVGGQPVKVYIQDLTRAEASDSKKPVMQEKWLILNKDGSVTIKSSSVGEYLDVKDKFLEIAGNLPKQAKEMKGAADKAAKSYEKIKSKVEKPKGVQ
ncbi:MAG: hypothetical protein V1906_00840 [Candidatus Woesearchaeota archaeon]